MELELSKSKKTQVEEDFEARAVQAVVNILTEEKYANDRLKVLRGFRLIFSKCVSTLENKLLNGFDIETLFDLVVSAVKGTPLGNEFQSEYFIFLLNIIKYSREIREKVRAELIRFIRVVLEMNEKLPDFVVRGVWARLEEDFIVWSDLIQEILISSKLFIEDKILEWVNAENIEYEILNVKYYAEASVECKDLFHIIITVLNQILSLAQGSKKILNIITYFVSLVSECCDRNGKTILRLYPRDCCQLVSLLLIPPEMCLNVSREQRIVCFKTEVLQLLLTKFKVDQNMVLLLLTHYPKWLKEFFDFLSTMSNK